MKSKEGGTYIVTGATGGIGKALVAGLVTRKVDRIVLACRNVMRAEEIVGAYRNVTTELCVIELDLESFESVRRFASEIQSNRYRLNGLINNAGTMPGRVRITQDGYESATQTNFLSTMLLTELLVPFFDRNSSVVFTTSMTRRLASFHNNWDEMSRCHHNRFVTYGRSKKMLTAYAAMLSENLKSKGINVNCSDPWIVDSGIISMGNKVIDAMSSALFRPLIYTPVQGAQSAFNALDSKETGLIFTLHKSKPIPYEYSEENVRKIIKKAIFDLS